MPDPEPASMFFTSFIVFLILFLLNLLYSLADTAFECLGETSIRELEEAGNRKAKRIRRFTEKPRLFASRIRLAGMMHASLATLLLIHQWGKPLAGILHGTIPFLNTTCSYVVSALLLTALTLFIFTTLGNILPRRLTTRNPEAVALATVDIFTLCYTLLIPFHQLCSMVAYPILRLADVDPHDDAEQVTEEDIRQMMDAGEELGSIEGVQADMVNNIFEFDDITADKIMTPRIDVAAVEADSSVVDALNIGVEEGYSRIPIYEEDIDHIIGMLYMKDLLPYVGQPIPADVTIRSLLRETHFVPESKKCDDLFAEMNEKRLQMAIVVDEYGGVAGIVTMEDLLESIVGNMQDEFDEEEEEVTQLDDHSFEVDGSLSMDDLEELLERDFPEGDYDTVAGFIMDLLGRKKDNKCPRNTKTLPSPFFKWMNGALNKCSYTWNLYALTGIKKKNKS